MSVFPVGRLADHQIDACLLGVPELKAWTENRRARLPLPPEVNALDGCECVSLSALVGLIGAAVSAQTVGAEVRAKAAVGMRPELAAHPGAPAADPEGEGVAVRWLAADLARGKWRADILDAVRAGALDLLDPATQFPLDAEALPVAVRPAPPAKPDEPSPLKTRELAECFAGLDGKNAQQWMKPLGDVPKWLTEAVHTRGSQGKSETRWHPVAFGAALVKRGVKQNSVRARFQTMPPLKPWLDAWKTYEAEYLDTE